MAKAWGFGAIAALALLAARPVGAGDSLESRLMPLIKAHKGKVAVAVKDLETGETFSTTPTSRCRRPA